MRKVSQLTAVVLFFLSFIISSCAAISAIFSAGMGFGIFIVIAVIVAIVFFVFKARKDKP